MVEEPNYCSVKHHSLVDLGKIILISMSFPFLKKLFSIFWHICFPGIFVDLYTELFSWLTKAESACCSWHLQGHMPTSFVQIILCVLSILNIVCTTVFSHTVKDEMYLWGLESGRE